MLCPTCPKRPTCLSACDDLNRELNRYDRPQFEAPKNPEQIEAIELRYALRTFFGTDFDQSIETDEPVRLTFPIDYEQLREDMQFLTARQRECLQLYYWDGLSKKAIARKLGLNRTNVRQHLSAGLAVLRRNYLTVPMLSTATPAYRGERVMFLKVSAA